MDVRESYDSAARAYAERLFTELDGKPLDRHLLDRFVEEAGPRGRIADVGCGPGHVARYLCQRGASTIGIDLSPGMIACASELTPGVDFVVGDMRRLDLKDGALSGIVAFYSIVHFTPDEVDDVVREWRRVVAPGGLALIAFHSGEDVVHADDLFGAPVDLTFRFHLPERVVRSLESASFRVIERADRQPYEGAEHQSRRCYLLARAG